MILSQLTREPVCKIPTTETVHRLSVSTHTGVLKVMMMIIQQGNPTCQGGIQWSPPCVKLTKQMKVDFSW